MMPGLTLLYPELSDLLDWTRARHPWATGPLLLAAGVAAVVQGLLTPRQTLATLRQGRRQAERQARIRQQTDSLYPLW